MKESIFFFQTTYVEALCKEASQKLHALACGYIDTEKVWRLMHASYCNYCQLVLMLPDRTLNEQINQIHERTLRSAQNNHEHDFGYLLE